MYKEFGISDKIINLAEETEQELKDIFKKYDEDALKSSAKILKAFQENQVSTTDFLSIITGYGDFDAGRNKLEKIYSKILGAEDTLVRPQITSGTHAIYLALSGLLKYGDTLISISGAPYDTLQSVIGVIGDSKNSLIANGIKYEQIELINNDFDYEKIVERIKQKNVKMVEIQRSKGYAQRKSLCISKIEKVIKVIKEADPNVIVMVDNCYGELVEDREPTEVGADIMASSLMKNLGGGIATSGGYVAGRADLVKMVAERLTAPCIGKKQGANYGQWFSYYMGLFMAPNAVRSTLKTITLASRMLEKLDFEGIDPKYDEKRTDIIQTLNLNSEENLLKFIKGLQKALPVDSHFEPVPEEMPGYPHPEIMANGSFTPGSTIELSADGPVIEPYTAYLQGGLTYEYGKLGIMIAIDNMIK